MSIQMGCSAGAGCFCLNMAICWKFFFFCGECSKVVPKSEVNPDVCCKSFMPAFQPSRVRKGKNNLDISWAYRSGISNRRGSAFNGFQLDSNAAIKFLEYVQSLHITGSKFSFLGRKHFKTLEATGPCDITAGRQVPVLAAAGAIQCARLW